MSSIIILIFWIGISFLVGLLGKDKSIGFWVVFLISIFFSPLIGLIVALASGTSRTTASKFMTSLELAKKAEFRGEPEEAIKLYKDALFDLNNAPKIKDRYKINHRIKTKKEVEQKLDQLNSK